MSSSSDRLRIPPKLPNGKYVCTCTLKCYGRGEVSRRTWYYHLKNTAEKSDPLERALRNALARQGLGPPPDVTKDYNAMRLFAVEKTAEIPRVDQVETGFRGLTEEQRAVYEMKGRATHKGKGRAT